jgi:hypothetical protein
MEFSKEERERAGALAADPDTAPLADLEALPDALLSTVIDAAVQRRSAVLPERLVSSPSKRLAKAGKRALYQLRSLGVAVAERREEPRAAPATAAPEPLPALLTQITGDGERGLILGRAVRGGIEALQIIFSDEQGLLSVSLREASRSVWRALFREPKGAVEIPFGRAQALFADAAQKNLVSKTPYPDDTDEALRHFGVTPTALAEEIPAPTADDAGLAAGSAALHDEKEIAAWFPPIDALRALALKHDEITASPLYINEGQRLEQLTHATRSAAESFFTPAMRRLYGARLWAMGDFFELGARPAPAALARAEARRLFHGAPGASAFGHRLFEKVIAETGVPTPATAPAPPGERRSPGGLILP